MSLSITTYSVYLLDSLLFENMKQCEESVNTPGPVNALIQLTKYGKRRTENKINKYDAMYIRQLSNDCLACIRHFGGEQMWNLLIIQYGFIQAQIECVSICGGCEDEYIIANQMRLMNIKYAFDDLRNDMEDKQIKSDLEKVEEEIIEEEGGLEEIDSNKLHTQQLKEDGIYYWANQAMDSVLNTKKDITNEEDE
ncbi:MAG: hypothetical protein EZS28_001540 [Streblomastix strix]|uniref:Uncharacterized protein n=1 Tax=Streblomastix strix TaxID=222440 RepID=A0A5J4X6Q7_9EUKA|nr:MAG: hypothetical protein EZS28_001540 [Streblomastix strix]